jgi:hypothetical protein
LASRLGPTVLLADGNGRLVVLVLPSGCSSATRAGKRDQRLVRAEFCISIVLGVQRISLEKSKKNRRGTQRAMDAKEVGINPGAAC